jgi:hypothetical protein
VDLVCGPDGIDDLGLVLATSEFGVIVAGVTEGSVSSRADIHIGDSIVQVYFVFDSF